MGMAQGGRKMKDLVIDKSKWGSGPWQEEPDRIEWEHLGFPCLMTRTPIGNWCGYVAVPPGHPAFGKHFDDIEIQIHGGLTYSDHCQGHVCHVPKPGEPDNVWWFGFDCAHYLDLVPSVEPLLTMLGHPHPGFLTGRSVYRDVPYVKNEVENLAKQLHEKNLLP
jgi:hypothetical protein